MIIGTWDRKGPPVFLSPRGEEGGGDASSPWTTAAVTGRLYNEREIRTDLAPDAGVRAADGFASLALHLYEARGLDFLRLLNGAFAIAIWDKRRGRLIVARDALGVEPLYVHAGPDQFVFGSSLASVLRLRGGPRRLEPSAVFKSLLFNYNPGRQTLFQGAEKLGGGEAMIVRPAGLERTVYWALPTESANPRRSSDLAEELRSRLRTAVSIRTDGDGSTGVFLSGGLDSTTVLCLASPAVSGPLHTFSYRCRGATFDEAHYARAAAESQGARHHEILYAPEATLGLGDVVDAMEEPFCDAGITIAAALLGRAARPHVASVLTGDGGDELFAGHPVYAAEKAARWADALPRGAASLFSPLRLLSDSDRKDSLSVKLKRFVENWPLPSDLLANRWRVYYSPADLAELLAPSLAEQMAACDLFEDVRVPSPPGAKKDRLNRAIQSDYRTVVDFYLRRNDLCRRLGVDVRCPLLDPVLVAYCARLPSSLKMPGFSPDKPLLRRAMGSLLPAEIRNRRTKLGHSVPLKNWLRENGTVREFVLDHLSKDAIERRGLVRHAAVQRMIDDHLARRRNNSHRLWYLAVLESWLHRHYDAAPAEQPEPALYAAHG